MRIHLVDSGTELWRARLLLEESPVATLVSYHYVKGGGSAYRAWSWLWESQARRAEEKEREGVRIHLVQPNGYHAAGVAAQSAERAENVLRQAEDLRPRVIVDSGAFSAWSLGVDVRVEEYGEWALEFKKQWENRFASLHFINLDVIGDQRASWKNLRRLEKMGLEPLPVITGDATEEDIRRTLDGYDYFCVGGLMGDGRRDARLRRRLDPVFRAVVARWRATGVMPKVHLLGVTTPWVLERYPTYSSDSSSWVGPVRYGNGSAAGLRQRVPRISEGPAERSAVCHALRAEIRRFKKMEADATRLWEKRGVIFDD